jgi:hypothetical protein
MGAERTEIVIVALVMAATGLILLAPLLGRVGHRAGRMWPWRLRPGRA